MLFYHAKRLIRQGLNRLGYDIRKLHRGANESDFVMTGFQEKLSAINNSGGMMVEFVGPSGVGKTTLYNVLLARRMSTDIWITVDELLNFYKKTGSNQCKLNEVYEILLTMKLKDVTKKEFKIIDKYSILDFFYKNIQIDAIINNQALPALIVLHDGIIHNFSNELYLLNKNNTNLYFNIFKNRAVVHCYASPQLISENILKRNSEGHSRPQHKFLTKGQLMEQSGDILTNKAQFVAQLKQYKIPCLEINMENDISQNVATVNKFIGELDAR